MTIRSSMQSLAAQGLSIAIRFFAAVLVLSKILTSGYAQQGAPHLAYVYPAGGEVGTSFQITIGGQFLMSVSNAFFSGKGITATVLGHNRPMNQKDFNDLRDRMRVLQEKFQNARRNNFAGTGTNSWTTADAKEREEIREKILRNPPNRTANPAMTDTVTIKLAIARDAQPGDYEVRLATPNALSNPMRFCVGTLTEMSGPAAKPANPDFDKMLEKLGGPAAPVGTPKHAAQVALPVTVNGQIMPGGVDNYRFSAVRGQHLVIAVSARALIPYLADAVPGWFEAVITVLDSKGREISSAERYHLKPDPVIHFDVPEDGQYTVQIHDSIFRGREDFVYRLTIGEVPFITGIYPLGGPAGCKTKVRLKGWNLTNDVLTVDNSQAAPGVIAIRGTPCNAINTVPFAVDDLPECAAAERNHSEDTAQPVMLPIMINGHVSRRGESEVFEFEGHAGERIVAEVFARRLDSPLDSSLWLTDSMGKQLAFNDDFEDKGNGMNTFHADSYLTNTLPADGTYFVHLRDAQGQGGPEFAYRLRISHPQPDFALRVVPSSLSLRTGMSAPVTVYALRRDGFTNVINLDLKEAPRGFSLSGARIAENQDKAQFTLKAPAQAFAAPATIAIQGQAIVGDKLVSRDAVPAEDLMQAFFYRHLVPSKELAVIVRGQERPFMRDAFKILSAMPMKIPSGGTARVQVSVPTGNFASRFQLELANPPDGIRLMSVASVPAGLELEFSCDAGKVKQGSAGNLICTVEPKNPDSANPKKKAANLPRKAAIVTLPAVSYQVMAE